jgi:hypothetical protein
MTENEGSILRDMLASPQQIRSDRQTGIGIRFLREYEVRKIWKGEV